MVDEPVARGDRLKEVEGFLGDQLGGSARDPRLVFQIRPVERRQLGEVGEIESPGSDTPGPRRCRARS